MCIVYDVLLRGIDKNTTAAAAAAAASASATSISLPSLSNKNLGSVVVVKVVRHLCCLKITFSGRK